MAGAPSVDRGYIACSRVVLQSDQSFCLSDCGDCAFGGIESWTHTLSWTDEFSLPSRLAVVKTHPHVEARLRLASSRQSVDPLTSSDGFIHRHSVQRQDPGHELLDVVVLHQEVGGIAVCPHTPEPPFLTLAVSRVSASLSSLVLDGNVLVRRR